MFSITETPKEVEPIAPDKWLSLAADGYRVHITEDAAPCKCGKNMHSKIKNVAKNVVSTSRNHFVIQKKFLIEALAGMGDIVVFYSGFPSDPILITDREGQSAIIMPMGGSTVILPESVLSCVITAPSEQAAQ